MLNLEVLNGIGTMSNFLAVVECRKLHRGGVLVAYG